MLDLDAGIAHAERETAVSRHRLNPQHGARAGGRDELRLRAGKGPRQSAGDVGQGVCAAGSNVRAGNGVDELAAVDRQRQTVACFKAARQRQPVGLERNELDPSVDDSPLFGRQLGVERTRDRLGNRSPLLVRDRDGVVQRRCGDPVLLGDRAVVKRLAGPRVNRYQVVVVGVAQGVGDHQALHRAEILETGVGVWCDDSRGGPVYRRVAVIGRYALNEACEHLLASGSLRVVIHGAAVHRIAQELGHRLLLRHGQGGKCRAADRCTARLAPIYPGDVVADDRTAREVGQELAGLGIEEATRRMDLVAQAQCDLRLGRFGQIGKGDIAGHGNRLRLGSVEHQLAAGEQRLQRGVHLALLEAGHDGCDVRCRSDLDRLTVDTVGLAGQGIEVIGEAVLDPTDVERHRAGSGQRSVQRQLAARPDLERGVAPRQVSPGLVVEPGARDDGRARQQLDMVGRLQADRATVLPRRDRATFEQHQAGTGTDIDAGIAAVVGAGKDAGCAADRMRSHDADQAVAGQRLDRAALVGTQAVDLAAVGDEAALTGARSHLDIEQPVRDRPARHEHLLVDLEHQFVGEQAGIRRAKRRMHVLARDLKRARLDRQPLAGLDVANDLDAIGLQGHQIIESGREIVLGDPGILDVADAHQHATGAVADRQAAEAISQRGQIAHPQLEEAGSARRRIVYAVAGLGGATEAVALIGRVSPDQQRARSRHLVRARGEIDVVGDDRDVAGNTRNGARVEREQGLAAGELHVDVAGSGVEATQDASVVDDAQVVALAQHDVVI